MFKNKETIEKFEKLISDLKIYTANGMFTNKVAEKMLLQFLYDNSEMNVMEMILQLNECEKQKTDETILLKNMGLNDATGYLGNSKFLKGYSNSDGIVQLINVVRAFFPKGNSKNASKSQLRLFNHFKDLLVKHEHEYTEGKSKWWADNFDHMDYIKLVIAQSKEKNK